MNTQTLPAILFVGGLVGLVMIASLCIFAVWKYNQAKKIAPEQLRLEELKKQIVTVQQTLDFLRKQERELNSENAKITASIALNKQLEDDLKSSITHNQKDCAYWKICAKKKREEIALLDEALIPKQNEIDQISGEIAMKNQELGSVKRQIESENEKSEKAKADLQQAKNELIQVQSEITGKKKELTETQADLDRCKSEKRKYDDEIQSLIAKIEVLKGEKKKLEEDKEKLEKEAQKLRKEQESKAKELDNEIAAKTSEIGRLEDRIRQLGGTLDADEDRIWSSLETSVESTRKTARKDVPNEIEWLKEFQKNLGKVHLPFNERIIKAFHTSLKSSDAMPIAVLSGISGTGKSLLPQLYATASGMDFTPIPVQPRWDGPQDIFGFYNYIEGCYKATELSRLFWQYNKETQDKNLPMHIVLLDEMNLARVEYYFSELLSMLEIRRTNPEKAKTILEGSGRGNQTFKREFRLRENVLFVGTMNEDETTQTLSDKVLDRSSVMRFGRPKELSIMSEATTAKKSTSAPNFEEFYDKEKFLSYASWKKMISESANVLPDKFHDILRETNEAMAYVNRPFGHRIANAIATYVRNYPGNDVKSALSDAFEMKIFPKLNGLETDTSEFSKMREAFQRILGKEKFFDGELRNAFVGSSAMQTHAYFKWRGIAR